MNQYHASITRNPSWSLSDDRIRACIRCIDNPSAGTDRSEQRGAAADGELGRCEPELAGMVLRRAKHLE
jgi:hypothetical protein